MKLRKNIHRLLAIVLALNLSLSLVNVTAMAANEDAGRILVCGKVEHTHDETCYGEPEIICGLEEGAGRHIHTEECYGEVKTLICGQEENGGHVHGDECYQVTETRTLICGEEERETPSPGRSSTRTGCPAPTWRRSWSIPVTNTATSATPWRPAAS